MKRFNIMAIGALLLSSVSIASADQRVPLKDGLYANSPAECAAMRRGESDGARYSVDKGGRMFDGPEQACVIASIKKIRANRYHVQTDCREYDEISQQSFILDVPTSEHFAIEGDDYRWCITTDGLVAAVDAAMEKQSALSKLTTAQLVNHWAGAEEGCRGGAGDDSKTNMECDRRTVAAQELNRRGHCYRKTRSGMDWISCKK